MDQIIQKIKRYKLFAVIRSLAPDKLLPTVSALCDGGVKLIELTFDHSNKISEKETADMIMAAAKAFSDTAVIGAGTVLSSHEAQVACEAGAQFIVSPCLIPEVVKQTLSLGRVSIPGAFSPTEILAANNLGAHFVKIFPADSLGIDYIKSVLKPLCHIPCIATGGIDLHNAKAILDTGCCGIGVGSVLADNKLIENNEFDKLTTKAKEFADIIQKG